MERETRLELATSSLEAMRCDLYSESRSNRFRASDLSYRLRPSSSASVHVGRRTSAMSRDIIEKPSDKPLASSRVRRLEADIPPSPPAYETEPKLPPLSAPLESLPTTGLDSSSVNPGRSDRHRRRPRRGFSPTPVDAAAPSSVRQVSPTACPSPVPHRRPRSAPGNRDRENPRA